MMTNLNSNIVELAHNTARVAMNPLARHSVRIITAEARRLHVLKENKNAIQLKSHD